MRSGSKRLLCALALALLCMAARFQGACCRGGGGGHGVGESARGGHGGEESSRGGRGAVAAGAAGGGSSGHKRSSAGAWGRGAGRVSGAALAAAAFFV